jgi:nucleoside-diphosphate-sugar epimerase
MRELMASAQKEGYLVVTGASGYIGRHVLDEARLRGWGVLALSRRPPHRGDVVHLPYDLNAPLPEWPALEIMGIIHLAYDASEKAVRPEREVAAAEELVTRARELRVPFVFVSSQNAGLPTRYGRVKEAIENVVLREGGAVVRVGLVYGGYRAGSGLFWRLDEWVRRWPVVPFFLPSPRVVPIHVSDVARWLCHAVDSAEARGKRVFLHAGAECSLNGFLWYLCRHRRRGWCLPVPVPLWGARPLARLFASVSPRYSWLAQRIEGLIGLRPALRVDGEVVQVPGRTLADGLHPTGSARRRQWLQQGRRLFRGLLGHRVPSLLVRHYARACEAAESGRNGPLSEREREILAIALLEYSPWGAFSSSTDGRLWVAVFRGFRLLFVGLEAAVVLLFQGLKGFFRRFGR